MKTKDIRFDDWQQEILDSDDNILLCKGRRIGGTEIFSIKAVKEMFKTSNLKIVFVSLTEDQAQLCIDVAYNYSLLKFPKFIGKGKRKPTLNKLFFTNGSSLIVRPVGATGNSVRSFEGDIIGIDEAPWQDKKMWRALRPIIATSEKCRIWMWGTPGPKEGYFYEQFHKILDLGKPGRFRVWKKTTEEVLSNRPICETWTEKQRENALAVLQEEKEDMSDLEYRNEFMAEFVDEINQYFPDYLISKAQILDRLPKVAGNTYYCGVDYATMGGDLIVFSIFEKIGKKFYQRESLSYKYKMPTETNRKMLELDTIWDFKEIYIDSGGAGIALADFCMYSPQLKNKTIQIDNASRSITPDATKKKKLLKEDLYANTLSMLDNGEVELLKDEDISRSFKSIVKEYDAKANIFIYGRFSHHVESIIRALWANHSTRLNLWVR